MCNASISSRAYLACAGKRVAAHQRKYLKHMASTSIAAISSRLSIACYAARAHAGHVEGWRQARRKQENSITPGGNGFLAARPASRSNLLISSGEKQTLQAISGLENMARS